jgi:hypothetical protein
MKTELLRLMQALGATDWEEPSGGSRHYSGARGPHAVIVRVRRSLAPNQGQQRRSVHRCRGGTAIRVSLWGRPVQTIRSAIPVAGGIQCFAGQRP